MTVYIDQLWVLNSVVDYLLLSASGSLLGVPIQRGRLAAAGALGGIYAVLSLIPQLGFLQTVCFRLLTAALLCLCAFGQVRGILRQTVVLFLLAAAFSGITLLLTECFSAPGALIGGTVYYPLSVGVLVLTAGGATGLIVWGLGRLMQHGGNIAQVDLRLDGRKKRLTALYDTGNTLRDPMSGQRVMVADWTLLRELFPELGLKPEEVRRPGTLMERMAREVPQLHPRLIPYKTASTEQGMLLALRPEWMQVDGKEEKMLVAFSPVTVSDGGGYQALLGGVR